jgi:hypothetical protein
MQQAFLLQDLALLDFRPALFSTCPLRLVEMLVRIMSNPWDSQYNPC